MKTIRLAITLITLATGAAAHADWKDLLNVFSNDAKEAVNKSGTAGAVALSSTEIVAGLKEALDKATEVAVNELGHAGGFLDNPQVRIPLPEELDWVEKGLRKVGQEELADKFIATMNGAAEQAVPAALEQFRDAISAMSPDDAMGILKGPEDAATQYFRSHSEATLREQFLPIVKETTNAAGVTAAYKNMTGKLGGLAGMFGAPSLDVDEYVTGKTLDGLFTLVAQEEARIRKDPLARGTELLKRVFGGQ